MNNNLKIPQIALGTYATTNEEMTNVIECALSVGYRHIDCAWIYKNEKMIGKCLSNQLKKGEIKRSDLFLQVNFGVHFINLNVYVNNV